MLQESTVLPPGAGTLVTANPRAEGECAFPLPARNGRRNSSPCAAHSNSPASTRVAFVTTIRHFRAQYPEFELVLVSNDHSAAEMLAYMRDEKMPWPAIKYSELDNVGNLTRLAGRGIPCLVLVDGNGKVLADSFKGNDYLGPDSVLDATERLLKKNRGG